MQAKRKLPVRQQTQDILLLPVSYTHLDVYKRQELINSELVYLFLLKNSSIVVRFRVDSYAFYIYIPSLSSI